METKTIRVQGRDLTPQDIRNIQELIENNPSWSRRKLSQELCRLWNWRNGKGMLKDMASRSMMLKLDKKGYIKLPPRRQMPVNRMAQKKAPYVFHEKKPIECSLKSIQPITIKVSQTKEDEALYSCLLSEYHYLSYKGIVGQNIKYLVYDNKNRILACVLFGSSAWKASERDTYIGWSDEKRQANLNFITNNMRFLILPWVRVKHLASHILGQIARRISSDWIDKYGHPIFLIETFVEKDRFKGTCYKAANWIRVGETTGRSRNDQFGNLNVPIKDIYLYPLTSKFKEQLSENG